MTSQDKLIKQGIKYTDALFDELSKRLANGVKSSDTLEDFLSKYNEYTDGNGENNPLVVTGYKDQMLKIILSETNNHKFSRPSQKEMVRVVIENRVGDLIVDVGEDVRENVRDIVKEGYNNELSQDEIAEQITNKVSSIKNRRARAIARTEIARTAVTSDYIISKERGATHFYVECRNTACPVCKKAWHTKWTPENDDSFNPKDTSAGGKGWIGDRVFSMSDVGDLPPKHPNCRCVPYFYKDKKSEPVQTTTPVTETVEETVTENPRIAELEKELTDVQAIADKWRARGNSDLAKSFESDAKRIQDEINQLKNPNATTVTNPPTDDLDMINDILADVLDEVGIKTKTPKPSETKKNIQTTHESNLWETLAEKNGFELTEASNTFVAFHDTNHDTTIRFNIASNDEWVDYTNRNKKARNMEDFLKCYNNAPSNIKKSSPTINIVGSKPYAGVCELSMDKFEINIARGGYQELALEKGSGNLQHTMLHEMMHAHDMRCTDDRTFTLMGKTWWASGNDYKNAITRDRRSKKKNGGKTWVSEYVRTANDRSEDWADLGGIVAFRDMKDKSHAYLYERNKYGELVKVGYNELKKRYPNRWKVLEEHIFGDYQCKW